MLLIFDDPVLLTGAHTEKRLVFILKQDYDVELDAVYADRLCEYTPIDLSTKGIDKWLVQIVGSLSTDAPTLYSRTFDDTMLEGTNRLHFPLCLISPEAYAYLKGRAITRVVMCIRGYRTVNTGEECVLAIQFPVRAQSDPSTSGTSQEELYAMLLQETEARIAGDAAITQRIDNIMNAGIHEENIANGAITWMKLSPMLQGKLINVSDELPNPSADLLDRVFLYIGEDTEKLKKDSTYICRKVGDEYMWVLIRGGAPSKAYLYVGFAQDPQGTDFSTTPSDTRVYRAEIVVEEPIENPTYEDFKDAVWIRYKEDMTDVVHWTADFELEEIDDE